MYSKQLIYRLSVIFASLVSGNDEEVKELPEEGETSFCNCFNFEVSSYTRDTLHTHSTVLIEILVALQCYNLEIHLGIQSEYIDFPVLILRSQ